jgi:hypothetical protein
MANIKTQREKDRFVIETGKLKVEVNLQKGFFDVVEKDSGTVWLHDLWEEGVGKLVLRRTALPSREDGAYLDTEVSGFGANSQALAEDKDIPVIIGEGSTVSVKELPDGASVTIDGLKVKEKTIDFKFTYEIRFIKEETFCVDAVGFDLDPSFHPHALFFPLRFGCLLTAQDTGYLVLPFKTGGLYMVGEKAQRPDEVIPGPIHSCYDDPMAFTSNFSSASFTMSWFGAKRGGFRFSVRGL